MTWWEDLDCCCIEVERWKENDEDGYHGNELHQLKMSSSYTKLLNFIITYLLSDAYMRCPSQNLLHKFLLLPPPPTLPRGWCSRGWSPRPAPPLAHQGRWGGG